MKINLNGSVIETDHTDLLSLARSQGLNPGSLVIEHNALVIKQEDWSATQVREGDTIELLNFVGGG